MSLFAGRQNDGSPAIQFTKVQVEESVMQQGPSPATTFHSALDYTQSIETHIIQSYDNHPYEADYDLTVSSRYFYAPEVNTRVIELIEDNTLFSTNTKSYYPVGGYYKVPTDPRYDGGYYPDAASGDISLFSTAKAGYFSGVSGEIRCIVSNASDQSPAQFPVGWSGLPIPSGTPGNIVGSLALDIRSPRNATTFYSSRCSGSFSGNVSLVPSGDKDQVLFRSNGISMGYQGIANLDRRTFSDYRHLQDTYPSVNTSSEFESVAGMSDYVVQVSASDYNGSRPAKVVPEVYTPGTVSLASHGGRPRMYFTQYNFLNVEVSSFYPFDHEVTNTPNANGENSGVKIDKNDLVVGDDFSFKGKVYMLELPKVVQARLVDGSLNITGTSRTEFLQANWYSYDTDLAGIEPLWDYMSALFPVGETLNVDNFNLPHQMDIHLAVDENYVIKYWRYANTIGAPVAFAPDVTFPNGGMLLTNDTLRFEDKTTGKGVDIVSPSGGMLRLQPEPIVVSTAAMSFNLKYLQDNYDEYYSAYLPYNQFSHDTHAGDPSKFWTVIDVVGTAPLPADTADTRHLTYMIEPSALLGPASVTRGGATSYVDTQYRKVGAPLEAVTELRPRDYETDPLVEDPGYMKGRLAVYDLDASNFTGYDSVSSSQPNASADNKAQAVKVSIGYRINWSTHELELVRVITGSGQNSLWYTIRGDGNRTHRLYNFGNTEVVYGVPPLEVSLQILSATEHFVAADWS